MIDAMLFDASPVATFVCDGTTLAILAANDRASADFAHSRSELLALTLLDLTPPEDRSSLAEAFASLGDTQALTLRERRKQARDGSVLHVDLSISLPVMFNERRARVVIVHPAPRRFLRAVPTDPNVNNAATTLLEAEGLRDDVLLIAGGPRVTNLLATELGYDAGFGRNTLPSDVAAFIAQRLAERVPA